jgi:hypothetical protein
MKSYLLLAATGLVWASFWNDLPSFDWSVAWKVAAVTAAVAAVAIVAAIALPFVAIQAGVTVLGTAVSVAGISVLIGTGAGIAAGLYWGAKEDAYWREVIEKIKAVSNQLDIYFEPAAENKGQAADFRCSLVIYEETDLTARPPRCTERQVKIEAADSEEFYRLIDQQLKAWLHKPVLADQENKPRRVKIYMRPYPGEGVYERLRQLVDTNGIRDCVVERSEQSWKSVRPTN